MAMIFTVDAADGDEAFDTVVSVVGDAIHDNLAGVEDVYAKSAVAAAGNDPYWSIPQVLYAGKEVFA